MSIRSTLKSSISTVTRRSRLRRDPSYLPDPVSPHVDVLVNFPDGEINLYQIRQWYGPLSELARHYSVAILCYRPETAAVVAAESPVEVKLMPSFGDFSEIENDYTPNVILYPNLNYSNFGILGLAGPMHVFISHGESDKVYMASNWLKVFDYFFVAGEASKDRVRGHLLNYDVDKRTIPIGRPQIDVPSEPPYDLHCELPTVLYAPTWEGGRQTMRYGSVASHGRELVDAILSDKSARLIYRPHPRTGIHLEATAQADTEIRDAIHRAAQETTIPHFVDESIFGWQLGEADAMITDISAVAYDWLTTAKPLVITRPEEALTPVPENGLIARTELLAAADAGNIVRRLREESTNPARVTERAALANYYYGDRTSGASLARFIRATESMIEQGAARNARSQRTTASVKRTRRTLAPFKRGIPVAKQAVRTRIHSRRAARAIEHSTTSSLYGRPADIVLSVMGRGEAAAAARPWLSGLESAAHSTSMAVITGRFEAYEKLRAWTGLRVFIGAGNGGTEELTRALAPFVVLTFEQSKLNLREATYRDHFHVFVGAENSRAWLNNRLRLYDAIVVPPGCKVDDVLAAVPDLGGSTRIIEFGDLNEVADAGERWNTIFSQLREAHRAAVATRSARRSVLRDWTS